MDEKWFQLSEAMMRIGRMKRQIIEKNIGDLDIHPSEHMVLMHLADCAGGCCAANRKGAASQAEIARKLHVTPASIARTIKNLDADGYIARTSSGEDGRRNETALTEKGEALLERSKVLFHRVEEESFAGFSAAELEDFAAYLERVLQNLSRMNAESKAR